MVTRTVPHRALINKSHQNRNHGSVHTGNFGQVFQEVPLSVPSLLPVLLRDCGSEIIAVDSFTSPRHINFTDSASPNVY